MTVQSSPTGEIAGPAEARLHPAGTEPGTTGVSDAEFKHEEVVAVIPQSTSDAETGRYLIYTLSESNNNPAAASSSNDPAAKDDTGHFRLRAVPYPATRQQPLPPNLTPFVLDKSRLPPHLTGTGSVTGGRRLHVIALKRSGLGLAPEFYARVLAPLFAAVGVVPDEVTVVPDGGGGLKAVREAMRRVVEESKKGREVTAVVLAGDGGVVELLNVLNLEEDGEEEEDEGVGGTTCPPPTVALVPLGTGNALFHSLHKPLYSMDGGGGGGGKASPLVLALRSLLFGTPSPLPTFRASFSPGARLAAAAASDDADGGDDGTQKETEQHAVSHILGAVVASYGFHATLVWASDTPEYRVHGDKRFGMAAAELLREAHAYDAEVLVRWKGSEEFVPLSTPGNSSSSSSGGGGGGGESSSSSSDRFSYLVLTLVSNLEKTFTISPTSRPLDGVLRAVWFGAMDGQRTMEIMTAAYQEGAHVSRPEVGYTGNDESRVLEEVRVVVHEAEPRWRKVCVDGSIVEVERDGWVSVKRESRGRERLRVVVDGSVLSSR
ncbi:hypothetical protein VTJ04DRAFT_5522 [Mycothermus thermophilus]|uniref:uncharacterized protein n=1 Tax=Humicola insolens TaxID=85995 RepID=UPI0037443D0B